MDVEDLEKIEPLQVAVTVAQRPFVISDGFVLEIPQFLSNA